MVAGHFDTGSGIDADLGIRYVRDSDHALDFKGGRQVELGPDFWIVGIITFVGDAVGHGP
ncbi:hypothetical protein LCGC14_2376150, partial [marine sediment metagenome]